MTIFDFADKHLAISVLALLCLTGVLGVFADALRRRGLTAADRKALAAAVGRLDMAAGMIAASRVTSKPGAAIRVVEHTLTESAREGLSADLEKMPPCV